MSVFATITLVVTPAAVLCLVSGLYWWCRRVIRRERAQAAAERQRLEVARDKAVEEAERLGDGLREAIDLIDWGRPGDARTAAERALKVSTYAGRLRRTQKALEILGRENAVLRDRLGELPPSPAARGGAA